MALPFCPAPKFPAGALTRAERKQAKKTAEAQAERNCYRTVDARDGRACRVCKRLVSDTASMLDRVHHHHLLYRSRGGQNRTDNVLTLCRTCHDALHLKGTLRLEGDADLRDERGKLRGVACWRLTEAGWKVEKWI